MAPEPADKIRQVDQENSLSHDLRWMAEAVGQARKAPLDVPIGAVLVLDDVMIASGYNQKEAGKDPTLHAEMIAIRNGASRLGNWRLSGTTLYTTLEPCPMCAEAIIQARIDRLVFGAYDPVAGAAGSAFNLFISRRACPLPEVTGGIHETICSELIADFFHSRRDDAQKRPTPE